MNNEITNSVLSVFYMVKCFKSYIYILWSFEAITPRLGTIYSTIKDVSFIKAHIKSRKLADMAYEKSLDGSMIFGFGLSWEVTDKHR